MKRTIVTTGAFLLVLVMTAIPALADYPPSPVIKGTTVDPSAGTAFTGANASGWLFVAAVFLALGITLLFVARRVAARKG